MTKDELDAVEAWLAAANAAFSLCRNPDAFRARIAEQEERRDAIVDSLDMQWQMSNNLDPFIL